MKIERDYINKMLQAGRLLGSDKKCEYYPCHFDKQDCTWCFCPFYPCQDKSIGGRLTKSDQTNEIVWDCGNCDWIHKPDVARHVLSELLSITRTINKVPLEKLAETRLKVLKKES